MRYAFSIVLLLLANGCAPAPAVSPKLEALVFAGSDGARHGLGQMLRDNELTVFVFYSETCPCLAEHEARLRKLQSEYEPRDVEIYMVNSEVGGTAAHDAAEARRRGYPFVLLTDEGAHLARSLGAEFATHAIIVDRAGRLRYSGGIDSDKAKLHEDARPFLRDALEALLSGREPPASGEALGCVLQLR